MSAGDVCVGVARRRRTRPRVGAGAPACARPRALRQPATAPRSTPPRRSRRRRGLLPRLRVWGLHHAGAVGRSRCRLGAPQAGGRARQGLGLAAAARGALTAGRRRAPPGGARAGARRALPASKHSTHCWAPEPPLLVAVLFRSDPSRRPGGGAAPWQLALPGLALFGAHCAHIQAHGCGPSGIPQDAPPPGFAGTPPPLRHSTPPPAPIPLSPYRCVAVPAGGNDSGCQRRSTGSCKRARPRAGRRRGNLATHCSQALTQPPFPPVTACCLIGCHAPPTNL
jgi:hypothetical protein